MERSKYHQKVVIFTNGWTQSARKCAAWLANREAFLVLNYPPSLKPRSIASATYELSDTNRTHKTYEEPSTRENVVAAAVAKYGAVHILIDNLCFPHDNFTEETDGVAGWSTLLQSNIRGAFKCTRAAWGHLRKAGFGRIILSEDNASGNDILRSAALYTLMGFAQTAAIEGARHNIGANVVCSETPLLSSGIALAKNPGRLKDPLFEFLVDELHLNESGTFFQTNVWGLTKMQWERANGLFLNPDESLAPSILAKHWREINDFTHKCVSKSAMDFTDFLPVLQTLPAEQASGEPDFQGKVVIVTGGASGLGRAYCHAFAKLGASLVVNDLNDPAATIREIEELGGRAVGVTASVDESQRIVQKALDAYGHIDVLINNAGFLRDRTVMKMEDINWDAVINVHLNGAYQMTQAVWPHFVQQRHGYIVNTCSTSGIYGNFGQSNYSAAKLGILGLSEAFARHGSRHNIFVNTIAPIASTAALARYLSTGQQNTPVLNLKPDYIAPFVVLLCSSQLNNPAHPVTGQLFELAGGWHASTRLRPANSLKRDKSSDQVQLSPHEPGSQTLRRIDKLKGFDFAVVDVQLEASDVILYNLAVGAKRSETSLLYEDSRSFQAVPTFGMIPYFSPAVIYHHADILPKFDHTKALLGGVYMKIFEYPLPTFGRFVSSRRLIEVLDKGNSAVGITGYTTIAGSTGKKAFYNEVKFFMRGAGGFGGPRNTTADIACLKVFSMPSRNPDETIDFKTSEEQAALYRLTGDKMPIHIDPEFSSRAGFPVPILHGMCFIGIAGKLLYQRFGRYRDIKADFIGVVIPGQTLRVEAWVDSSQNLVLFQVRIVETMKLCIGSAAIHLWETAKSPVQPRL